jgi:hypothetical protein
MLWVVAVTVRLVAVTVALLVVVEVVDLRTELLM